MVFRAAVASETPELTTVRKMAGMAGLAALGMLRLAAGPGSDAARLFTTRRNGTPIRPVLRTEQASSRTPARPSSLKGHPWSSGNTVCVTGVLSS